METIDDETTAAAIDFMDRQAQGGQAVLHLDEHDPHARLHPCPPESMRGKSGMPGNEYADGMMEHDGDVGKLLKALDDLGIADNTIVVYTTDNGPNQFSWPDAATTPFRSEKDTNWEGAFRVPAMVRWPGHIKAGEVSNEIVLRARLVPDAARGRRRHDDQGPPAQGRQPSAARPSRSISTATTSSPT